MTFVAGKTMFALVAAGWLAEALASTHGDIEAGVAAYKSGDNEAALTSYAAAEADLGERPEIHFNKGLALLAKDDKEGARKAFEHGTESEHSAVAASAEYELGNLELDAEAFDPAIERYTNCLKLQPDHANAKWNLELALLKKQQKEEEEKKKQEEQDKNKDENENKDEQNKDEQNKDEQKQDEEKKDEQKQDEPKSDEQKQDEQKQDEEKKDEPKPEEQKQDEPKQDEQKGEQQQQPQPQPLDRADLDKALEQLDAEDQFQLGRPMGRQVPVERDW